MPAQAARCNEFHKIKNNSNADDMNALNSTKYVLTLDKRHSWIHTTAVGDDTKINCTNTLQHPQATTHTCTNVNYSEKTEREVSCHSKSGFSKAAHRETSATADANNEHVAD